MNIKSKLKILKLVFSFGCIFSLSNMQTFAMEDYIKDEKEEKIKNEINEINEIKDEKEENKERVAKFPISYFKDEVFHEIIRKSKDFITCRLAIFNSEKSKSRELMYKMNQSSILSPPSYH